MEEIKKSSIKVNSSSTMVSTVLVSIFLIASVVLTIVLEPGTIIINEDGSFYLTEGENNMTWWKYALSPVIALTPANTNFATVWCILVLAVVIGAIFGALDSCGLIVYLVEKLAAKFYKNRYKLLFAVSLLIMTLSTTLGMCEELIPVVPVAVMLFYAIGWDSPLAMMATSLAGCAGFTVGVINPFNTGLAQSLSDEVTMYSGILFRLVLFILYYAVLWFFLKRYAKRIDANPSCSVTYEDDSKRKKELDFDINSLKADNKKDRALKWFGIVLCIVLSVCVCFITASTILSKLSERGGDKAVFYSSVSSSLSGSILYMIILGYFIAGIGACMLSGLKGKSLLKTMLDGSTSLLPATLMILIASAIGYIFNESGVSDTIVYYASRAMQDTSGFACVIYLMIFLIVLEVFIASSSGKAFLIMPLAFRLCTILGINHQLAVLAFLFADGFSNSLLPTNSGLLITLGLTPLSYTKWMKVTWKVFLSFAIISICALAFGYYILY